MGTLKQSKPVVRVFFGGGVFFFFLNDAGMWDVATVALANLQICSICFLSKVSLAVSVSLWTTPLPPPLLKRHPFMSPCTHRTDQIMMMRRKLMHWKRFFSNTLKCTHSMVVEKGPPTLALRQSPVSSLASICKSVIKLFHIECFKNIRQFEHHTEIVSIYM